MKKLYTLILLLMLCSFGYGANRATTWTSGQILTSTALNAEFNNIYNANIAKEGGSMTFDDDIPICFGTKASTYGDSCTLIAALEWDTGQTPDALVLWMKENNAVIIADTDGAADYAYAAPTNPTLVIKDATTAATKFGAFHHDGTNFNIQSGSGNVTFGYGTAPGTQTNLGGWSPNAAIPMYFEGATNDDVETLIAVTDPTSADKTITLPNATGTVLLGPTAGTALLISQVANLSAPATGSVNLYAKSNKVVFQFVVGGTTYYYVIDASAAPSLSSGLTTTPP